MSQPPPRSPPARSVRVRHQDPMHMILYQVYIAGRRPPASAIVQSCNAGKMGLGLQTHRKSHLLHRIVMARACSAAGHAVRERRTLKC